jgi:uncharacterized protein YdeI (YjbR/CyaY-like superfamily)
MEPVFFAMPDLFRIWLEEHHDTAEELLVGFYKTKSGQPSITWPESVDEALCFGWIDGRRKRIDDLSYTIRFTPRKPRSTWSAVNIKQATELAGLGRMHHAGLKAFAERTQDRSGIYSYEQEGALELDSALEQRFRANSRAWNFFQSQAAWYRKAAIWWVVSAKRDETRQKRFATLIEDSEHSRAVAQFTRTPSPKE